MVDEIRELTALSGRHARLAQSHPAFLLQHSGIREDLDSAASKLNQLIFNMREYINFP